MRFSVESWAPEYGIAVDAATLEDASEHVDVAVERELGDWGPVAVAPTQRPERMLFVDGIQRIDARVWIHDGDVSRAAVCASVAAGLVTCTPGRAEVTAVEVFRGLYAAASSGAGSIVSRHATYDLVPVASDDPDDVYFALHSQRTRLERDVSKGHAGDVVVFDGPLRGRTDPSGVGYVKTHHKLYLPETVAPVLGRLGDGERTPVFFVSGGPGGGRWSWYLRLPGPRSHPLSGIVRLELPGAGIGAAAVATTRADVVSAALPALASESHKEPRAPQNLYPIAGLEQELRRRLGDPRLLERSLRVAAATP